MDGTQTQASDQQESHEGTANFPAALAQAEQPAVTGEDTERSSAAAGSGSEPAAGSGSVLQEFLRDGPPQVEEQKGAQESEQRPVDLQQGEAPPADGEAPASPMPRDDQPREAQTPAEEPPRETAAEEPPTGGGTSLYDDDFGGPEPAATGDDAAVNLAGDPLLPEVEDPLLVEQFGDPVVLSSSGFAGAQDVTTTNFAAPPPPPMNEPDPLTEQRIAAGEFDDDGNGQGGTPAGTVITGTPMDDDLQGTAGDDTITANGGADLVNGGDGNDLIIGGPGDDTLNGGNGDDIFALSIASDEGADVVQDFGGGDVLLLSDVTDADGSGAVELADLDEDSGNAVSDAGGSLVLTFSGGTTVTLDGVDGGGATSFADLAGTVNVDFA